MSSGKLRLTNLMRLTLDTGWWTRYGSSDNNPDLDPHFTFPQAVPSLAVGEHSAISRIDDDTMDPNFLKAIANTAGGPARSEATGDSVRTRRVARHSSREERSRTTG